MFSNNVNRLEAHYQSVCVNQMADIPILNKALEVEAVGFVDWGHSKDQSEVEVGVLITPWFMNIVLLPKDSMRQEVRVGKTVNILFPDGEYSFLTQVDADFGIYLTCSLFSPMFDFKTQRDARETAAAAMAQLLQTEAFKQIKKDKAEAQQLIKDQEVLNKASSRRAFFKGGGNAC
ncbi:(NiFe) hydrogenase assembly chaperone [Bathymodiolus thermophilus thioautotrophic gill symbiont]|uniref:(NiFe) hydrogenase assembly chaperone n=1 Tax=Bathymodiolus thermophilus thioautotrophic gill symbiont TaxID=2360 RepID=A0A3G3IPQ8_9GAMM|nr:[NiFe]-hydrogenase assembly chaperone HybE [Bathymodiolus thermophilus thioautotrophic gill symbiont]AYQ57679.1 (NiFe) hydrogenase assembly chaperone [Bathymodiolus thermophilus thioautotrophic gill symbiont]